MRGFTVVIPTYNGSKRLPLVLDKLSSQINIEELSWEVIVVDNNSQDETEKVIREYQKNWYQEISLRYFTEEKEGAGFARKKAVQVANSPLIGFLDDDNIPGENWVAAAYEFAEKYFRGSKIDIDEGGNHSFENLESKIPNILNHFS